jgi:hypothetical protein
VEFAPLEPTAPGSGSDVELVPDHLNGTGVRPSTDAAFFRTAMQAGLLGVMANLIPFGLGMVLTGILAALLYHRANPGTLRGGKAARLGAMAGAISFAATALLTVMTIVLLNSQQKFHDVMMQAVEQGIANRSEPEVQSLLQWLHTPQGFGTVLAFGMVFALLLSILFAAVGGVIGSTLFRDRRRPPM